MKPELNKQRVMFFISVLFLALLFPATIFAQQFQPTGRGEIVIRQYYSVSYIESKKQAEWVYYSLTANMLVGSAKRSNNFQTDFLVSNKDYYKSGYDKGHLLPAADMKFSQIAMNETFLFSNISPQGPSFNRGIWKVLEEKVRLWANALDSIEVVCGGVLNEFIDTIGTNHIPVPKLFYKVVYASKTEQMIAFVLPNEKAIQSLENFVVSVDSVEQLTGIDFFPQLPDSIENSLEKSSNIKLWKFDLTEVEKQENVEVEVQKASSCAGITKSGNRCKRKAALGKKYCWQHE
jgi:endonuclease G